MRILFVCSMGLHRSRTAAHLFGKDHDTRYAGAYSPDNPVTKDDLDWADEVVVMEDHHRREIGQRFPKRYLQKRITCLDIPDRYLYGDTNLVQLLKERFPKRKA